MATVELGQTIRDVISKLEGVVIARHEYLYGCTRLTVQPEMNKDGKPADCFVLDEQQAILLDLPNILELAPRSNLPGGDRDEPQRPSPPAR